jgi:hypothetical protein
VQPIIHFISPLPLSLLKPRRRKKKVKLTSIWILKTSVCNFNTLFFIFPFCSAFPAVVPVPPAAAIASLKPPVPVSASSEIWAAEEMMARSEAETPARLDWSTFWALVCGEEWIGEKRKRETYRKLSVHFRQRTSCYSS